MKNVLFIVLLIMLSISVEKVSSQCIDTIGISPASVQSGLMVLTGWGVNELPNSYTWFNLRRSSPNGEFRPGTGLWTTIGTAWQPDSCTGWMMVYLIDINTIHPLEVIEFQVFMITSDGTLYSSNVSRVRGRRTPRFYQCLMPHPVITTNSQINVTGEDESLLFRKTEISKPGISRIGREFKITNGSDQYRLLVFDITGRLLIAKAIESSSFILSSEDLPQGMYVLQLINSEEKLTERVFLE